MVNTTRKPPGLSIDSTLPSAALSGVKQGRMGNKQSHKAAREEEKVSRTLHAPSSVKKESRGDTAVLLDEFEDLFLDPSIDKAAYEEEKNILASYPALVQKGKKLDKNSDSYYEPKVRGEVWGVLVPDTKEDARAGNTTLHQGHGQGCDVEIAKYPFAAGSLRAAYYARVKFDSKGTVEMWILKEFMIPAHRNEKEYANSSENSAVACYLAETYCRTHKVSKQIRAIKSRVLKVQRPAGAVQLYNMEEELPKDFIKWTNNAGVVVLGLDDLIRFSKWSYDYFDGYLMIADMQGCETSSEYLLTDPAILCKDLTRFGPTNYELANMIMSYEALEHWLKGGILPIGSKASAYRPGFSLTSDMRMYSMKKKTTKNIIGAALVLVPKSSSSKCVFAKSGLRGPTVELKLESPLGLGVVPRYSYPKPYTDNFTYNHLNIGDVRGGGSLKFMRRGNKLECMTSAGGMAGQNLEVSYWYYKEQVRVTTILARHPRHDAALNMPPGARSFIFNPDNTISPYDNTSLVLGVGKPRLVFLSRHDTSAKKNWLILTPQCAKNLRNGSYSKMALSFPPGMGLVFLFDEYREAYERQYKWVGLGPADEAFEVKFIGKRLVTWDHADLKPIMGEVSAGTEWCVSRGKSGKAAGSLLANNGDQRVADVVINGDLSMSPAIDPKLVLGFDYVP